MDLGFSLRRSCRVHGHDKRDIVFNDAFSNTEYVVSNCWMEGNFKLGTVEGSGRGQAGGTVCVIVCRD